MDKTNKLPRPIHSLSIDEFGTAMILFERPSPGLSARQVQVVRDSLIVDLAVDGRLVGVEILDPAIVQRLFSEPIVKLFKSYDIERAIL